MCCWCSRSLSRTCSCMAPCISGLPRLYHDFNWSLKTNMCQFSCHDKIIKVKEYTFSQLVFFNFWGPILWYLTNEWNLVNRVFSYCLLQMFETETFHVIKKEICKFSCHGKQRGWSCGGWSFLHNSCSNQYLTFFFHFVYFCNSLYSLCSSNHSLLNRRSKVKNKSRLPVTTPC